MFLRKLPEKYRFIYLVPYCNRSGATTSENDSFQIMVVRPSRGPYGRVIPDQWTYSSVSDWWKRAERSTSALIPFLDKRKRQASLHLQMKWMIKKSPASDLSRINTMCSVLPKRWLPPKRTSWIQWNGGLPRTPQLSPFWLFFLCPACFVSLVIACHSCTHPFINFIYPPHSIRPLFYINTPLICLNIN